MRYLRQGASGSSVVFIDEIDAIGRSRSGAVSMGGNDEREQNLNQLLAEIDGFKTNVGKPVMIMAATNRPEVLDRSAACRVLSTAMLRWATPNLAGTASRF